MKATTEQAQRLKQVLEELGITQKQLAAEAGLCEKTISNIMVRKSALSPYVGKALQEKHGISRKWLETGAGSMSHTVYSNGKYAPLLESISRLLDDYCPEIITLKERKNASERIFELVLNPKSAKPRP
ncbi:helix-turn-helix domain-containing protein [Rufibacter immobilis]|uniref:helix-turn-helix domain-containing protein n=1 Tax=Rufibacter immobilis TaxID=1348778 RepID=UPI0035E68766